MEGCGEGDFEWRGVSRRWRFVAFLKDGGDSWDGQLVPGWFLTLSSMISPDLDHSTARYPTQEYRPLYMTLSDFQFIQMLLSNLSAPLLKNAISLSNLTSSCKAFTFPLLEPLTPCVVIAHCHFASFLPKNSFSTPTCFSNAANHVSNSLPTTS